MNGTYQIGDVVMDNWTLVRKIGAGSFGTVYEAHREDFDTLYTAAIKIVTIPSHQNSVDELRAEGMDELSVTFHFKEMAQELSKEISLMSRFKGTANVVSYEDHRVIPHENGAGWDILLRMELLTPVTTIRERLLSDPVQVLNLGIDICKALALLEKQEILHRDIKLANIFLSRHGDYKLGDFGIAKVCARPSDLTSRQGTNTYMAPEVFWGKLYGPAADLYSLGIVLYRLTNDNRAPFLPDYPQNIRDEDRAVAEAKRHSGKALPPPKNAGKALSQVILKACAFRPEDRYESPQALMSHLQMLLKGKDAEVLLALGDTDREETTQVGNEDGATVLHEEDDAGTVVSDTSKSRKPPRKIWPVLAVLLLLLLGVGLAVSLRTCSAAPPDLPSETLQNMTSLVLPVSDFQLQAGQSLRPEVFVALADGTTVPCQGPKWSSSDDAVVLARGDVIVAVAPGTVILTVTAETDNGTLEYFCSALVEAPSETAQETTAPTEATNPPAQETAPAATKPQESKPASKPQETKPQETKPQETKPSASEPVETEPPQTQPPQVAAPTGYRISASSGTVYAFQEFTVYVTPNEEDADVTVYAKDPTGKVWTFQLGQRRSIDLYVDQMHLMGTWTIYASISNDAGTYSGASGGPYVKVSVISPF